MKPHDIGRMVQAQDPQLSPDGRHIAYVVSRVDADANTYRSQIWVVGTKAGSSPRPLTAGEHRDSQPRWSPDGQRLAFTSSRAKDDKGRTKSTLHLLPFEVPGETVLLASADEGFSDLVFSPDGRWLAMTHRTRGDHYKHDEIAKRPARKIEHLFFMLNGEGFTFDRPQHVWVAPTDGSGPIRNLTPGRWQCSSPAWFADSDRLAIAVSRNRNDFTFDIGIVDLHADDPDAESEDLVQLLTDGTGWYESPVVTPDGTVIVTGHDDPDTIPQNAHLGTLDPTTVAPPAWFTLGIDRTWATMTAGQKAQLDPQRTVLAALEDRGNTHLYRVSRTGETELVIGGDRALTGWSVGLVDGFEAIAFTATTPTQPSELFLLTRDGTQQLTSVAESFTTRIRPSAPEHFLVANDGIDIDAWICRPHDFDPSKKYPALLNIHGGPFTQYGNFFFDEVQMQAAAGYVVIYSNPRGGSGRDTAWAQAILGPKHKYPGTGWGGADYDDLMAVTDAALANYSFIDPDRVGVLGGSYGGYMTSWMVTHTDRFAAACSERAVNNLMTLEYGSDIAGFFAAEIGPRFVDDPDEYARMSPMTYVKDLNTPLLIIHSEDDLRCPVDQAHQMFVATQILGKPDVEYWLFPGENHELSRAGSPTHRIQRAEIILEFFDRHLQGAPEPV